MSSYSECPFHLASISSQNEHGQCWCPPFWTIPSGGMTARYSTSSPAVGPLASTEEILRGFPKCCNCGTCGLLQQAIWLVVPTRRDGQNESQPSKISYIFFLFAASKQLLSSGLGSSAYPRSTEDWTLESLELAPEVLKMVSQDSPNRYPEGSFKHANGR